MERLSMEVKPSFFRGSMHMEEGRILRRRSAFIIHHLLMRREGLVRSG
jgi:hypothetical protein